MKWSWDRKEPNGKINLLSLLLLKNLVHWTATWRWRLSCLLNFSPSPKFARWLPQEWKRILIFVFPTCCCHIPQGNRILSLRLLLLGSIHRSTCSKSTRKAQQVVLNSVVGALEFIIVVITCPKNIHPPNKFCLGPLFSFYILPQWIFLFLSLLSCYNRVIVAVEVATTTPLAADGALASVDKDELEGGRKTNNDIPPFHLIFTNFPWWLNHDFFEMNEENIAVGKNDKPGLQICLQNTWNPFKSWFTLHLHNECVWELFSLNWKWKKGGEEHF